MTFTLFLVGYTFIWLQKDARRLCGNDLIVCVMSFQVSGVVRKTKLLLSCSVVLKKVNQDSFPRSLLPEWHGGSFKFLECFGIPLLYRWGPDTD